MVRCHSCSRPVPEDARFCPSCGAPLHAPVEAEIDRVGDEERRVVTVVFADLVGFTALSERLDPEQVKRLVDRVFERLVEVVDAHGGVVDKVLGDALVALFGAPVAHEDDADRAVRAALGMQAALREFCDGSAVDGLRMRIGVNTGEVVVGTLAGTDYTAMGDVVNTASRLQELAPVGSVLVGEETAALCSRVVRLEPFESVQLRGRRRPTTVSRAVAVDTGRVSRRWISDVAYVGRRSELAMLGAVVATVRSGRSAIVAVTGEAGIGKSRLVAEAIDALVAECPETLVLEGACAPYGEPNVWWPIAGGLLEQLGLDRDAEPEAARERVVRRLSRFDELDPGTDRFDRLVEVVLHMTGQPSALDALGPAATRDAVAAGVAGALRRRAEFSPVVVWVDDLQWAAPLLLELLESIARQLAGSPVLIVTTARPDGDHVRDWPPPADPALTVQLSLEPLGADDSASLVAAAVGDELDADAVAAIASRSGGNPLFLIELARLADREGPATAADMPGSLRALIAARLDQLTPSQRAILDNATIVGSRGRVAALRDFAGEMHQTFDLGDLDALVTAGLLVREGGSWRFRSDVVREVAYRTLTKQARAQRHAGVARFLADHEPAAVDRRAHHTATAAELSAELGPIVGVPDDIADRAIDLLTEAAGAWQRQGAARRTLSLVERGLGLVTAGDPRQRRFLLLQIEALVDLRSLRRARTLLVELIELGTIADDEVVVGEAWRLLGTVEQMEGDLVAARRELGRAVEQFRRLGHESRLAEALRARGFAEVFGGSLRDADRFLSESGELFDRLGDARGSAWVEQHRAWVSFISGDHAASERRLHAAIEAFEELDDRAGRAWSCGLLAYVHHFNRRNDRALELAADALADARQWDDDWGAAMMINLQASIQLWRGEVDAARDLAERALAGFRRLDDRFGMIQALGTLDRALVALGRTGDAQRSIEEVLALSDSFGALAYPAIAAAGAEMHLGHGARAAELATEAIGRLDTTGANVDEGRVVLAFGRLLDGDADEALARLLDVDVEGSPFALAARATARAAAGDVGGALSDVRGVERFAAEGEISYWDLAVARVAGAVVATGDEAASRRTELRTALENLDDVVVRSYGALVLARLDGDSTSVTGRRAIGGWERLAVDLVPVAAADGS